MSDVHGACVMWPSLCVHKGSIMVHMEGFDHTQVIGILCLKMIEICCLLEHIILFLHRQQRNKQQRSCATQLVQKVLHQPHSAGSDTESARFAVRSAH